MRNLLQFKRTHSIRFIPVFVIVAVVFGVACSSETNEINETPAKLIVVSSPTDGVISKVLVSEGATVGKDAGIVEIEVLSEIQNTPTTDNPTNPVATEFRNVEAQIKVAEEDVKRTSIEVERVQPLVASNSVPQAQLDAARADFQNAQKRLQDLKEKENSLRTKNIIAQSNQGKSSPPDTTAKHKFITVRVPAAGILKVINARVGQKVRSGQPLATISQN